ncbi:hypothetical protein B0I03_10531 [Flavobacterium aquaticum]|uniref:Uncharacterized protein n=1 Tax=Flavobacterium aquaticum TaxID=1236486 RepID=A0A327YU99_9FLAO|nr:hypothetical protein [Flavobacterium aquaticum]RAK21599.1 hypothetical protein B0I03_10531 [Flavobacterium aquaticum]
MTAKLTITYTVILKFNNFDTLTAITKERLIYLINNNPFEIEYFGGELDNQADYMDEEMEQDFNNHSFHTFHFDLESSDEPNFEADNQEVIEILTKAINENEIKDVRNDGKDVEVFLY